MHGLKLKGTGPIKYHLGMTFHRNEHGLLEITPRRYINKMVDTYVRLFGTKPSTKPLSPLNKGDHPEIEDSEFLDDEGTQMYQSLVSVLQWSISIGQFDIATAVMTMLSFCAQPRIGHLKRIKCICGYLYKRKDAVIYIRIGEQDYLDLVEEKYDWTSTVYKDVTEILPKDAPVPLGNFVTLSHYVDANLYHNMLTGRSVTGVLHYLNKTPIDWYSKKQATIETATYGSELVSARLAVDQIDPANSPVSGSPYPSEGLSLWRQQVSSRQLRQAPLEVTQATQCPFISSGTRGSCLRLRQLHIHRCRVQPRRYSEQALGVSTGVEDPQAHTILWRNYCGLVRRLLSLRHTGAISLKGYIACYMFIYIYLHQDLKQDMS